MHNFRISGKLVYTLCVCLLFCVKKINSQIVIGTPSLGFSQACASDTFNSFETSFVFSPEGGLGASNQFTIEMSDADGDFSDSVEIYTSSPGSVTTSPATLSFSIPTTTGGENFRIRIKSSAPAATSSASTVFAAYYKAQDSPFTINNLVSSGAYCSGGSYLLTIDNPGSGNNDSPLNYPSLTFNWYKETGPTTSVFITQAPTLNVTEEGTYFVETNYGTCTSNSFSNRVTITEVVSGQSDAGISSSLGNPFCPANGSTTLTTITGNSYQWFKDGNVIPDATNQMYDTNESGTYSVQVDLGDCMADGEIVLQSELFEASINVSDINTIDEGETLTVIITEDANAPEFIWYLNNTLITGASEDNYDVTEVGSYKVVITETSGCTGSIEFEFTVNEAFPEVGKIPNIISPNGDGINDTWVIPPSYVSGTNTEVKIMTNRGKIVMQTNNYLNNWPENDLNLTSVNQIYYYVITTNNGTKKGSITVLK